MRLSARMRMIADIVPAGECIADIGTDHAYIPIELVSSGKFARAIASDINSGPLERAKDNITGAGLSGKIATRLSDGLKEYAPGEADTILIAGMGGRLMIRILEDGAGFISSGARRLVLQPQSEIPSVRRRLRESGFKITDEDMTCEDGKYYVVMVAGMPGEASEEFTAVCQKSGTGKEKPQEAEDFDEYTDAEDMLGPVLMKKKHPVLLEWIEWRMGVIDSILKKIETGARADELIKEKRILTYGHKIY